MDNTPSATLPETINQTDAACPLCGPTDSAVCLTSRDPDRITHEFYCLRACGACGVRFLWPTPTAEDMPAFYYGEYHPQAAGVLASRADALLRRLRRYRVTAVTTSPAFRPAAPSILDVGCGEGAFLSEMRALGWNVTGFEFSENAAETAKKRFGISVATGPDLADAGLAEASFDAITLWHVIEHTPDPVRLLAELRRLIRPGGRLVVAAPNIASLEAVVGEGAWLHLDLPRHHVHFSPRTLLAALCAAGFSPVRVTHVEPEFVLFGLLQTILNRFGGGNWLYNALKGRPRPGRLPVRASQAVASVAGAAVLGLPLAVVSLALSLAHCGGTFYVVATPRNDGAAGEGAADTRDGAPND